MSKKKKENKEVNEEVVEEEEEKITELLDEDKLKIEELEKEVAKLKNAYALAYADTENTRKRLQSETDNIKKYRIQSFALEILPVIDNFERALGAFENKEDQFYTGVKMIYDQLITSLKNEGVEEIDCLNQKFDPKYHQSIMMEKKEGVESGMVIEVLQKGYMLKDRVLRASVVKISE